MALEAVNAADAGVQGEARAHELLDSATPEERRIPAVREALRTLYRREDDRQISEWETNRRSFMEGRMLVCCDGMTSPTCECSRGSRRGCCSHHGGVCGCQEPPEDLRVRPRRRTVN
jgi:hypothetical protein